MTTENIYNKELELLKSVLNISKTQISNKPVVDSTIEADHATNECVILMKKLKKNNLNISLLEELTEGAMVKMLIDTRENPECIYNGKIYTNSSGFKKEKEDGKGASYSFQTAMMMAESMVARHDEVKVSVAVVGRKEINNIYDVPVFGEIFYSFGIKFNDSMYGIISAIKNEGDNALAMGNKPEYKVGLSASDEAKKNALENEIKQLEEKLKLPDEDSNKIEINLEKKRQALEYYNDQSTKILEVFHNSAIKEVKQITDIDGKSDMYYVMIPEHKTITIGFKTNIYTLESLEQKQKIVDYYDYYKALFMQSIESESNQVIPKEIKNELRQLIQLTTIKEIARKLITFINFFYEVKIFRDRYSSIEFPPEFKYADVFESYGCKLGKKTGFKSNDACIESNYMPYNITEGKSECKSVNPGSKCIIIPRCMLEYITALNIIEKKFDSILSTLLEYERRIKIEDDNNPEKIKYDTTKGMEFETEPLNMSAVNFVKFYVEYILKKDPTIEVNFNILKDAPCTKSDVNKAAYDEWLKTVDGAKDFIGRINTEFTKTNLTDIASPLDFSKWLTYVRDLSNYLSKQEIKEQVPVIEQQPVAQEQPQPTEPKPEEVPVATGGAKVNQMKIKIMYKQKN